MSGEEFDLTKIQEDMESGRLHIDPKTHRIKKGGQAQPAKPAKTRRNVKDNYRELQPAGNSEESLDNKAEEKKRNAQHRKKTKVLGLKGSLKGLPRSSGTQGKVKINNLNNKPKNNGKSKRGNRIRDVELQPGALNITGQGKVINNNIKVNNLEPKWVDGKGDEALVTEAVMKHRRRQAMDKYGYKKKPSTIRCNVPCWGWLLMLTILVVTAAVSIGVAFMLNQEMEVVRPAEPQVSRCRDTFVMFPDQYHEASTLEEASNTLQACMDRCLLLPRAMCAAIDYNKHGIETNRCYMLEFTALSSRYGTYRGVDEYQRIQCDTIRESTVAPNRSMSTARRSTAGSSPTTRRIKPGVRTTACPATYTKTPGQFGTGGLYLPSARTVDACLSACSNDPYCPAIEHDEDDMRCYVHRTYFNGNLYAADGLNHYAKNPCGNKPTTPETLYPSTPLMSLLMTTAKRSQRNTPDFEKVTPQHVITSSIRQPPTISKRVTPIFGRVTTRLKRTTPMRERVTTVPLMKPTARKTVITSPTTSPTTTSTTSSTTGSTTSTTTLPTTSQTTPSTTSLTTSSTTSPTTSPLTTTTQLPPIREKCTPSDVTIILDTSGRLDGPGSKHFVHTVNLVKNIINNLKIGPSHTRVSAIIFSTIAVTAFHMEDYRNKRGVLWAMDQLQFIGGLSNLPRAMRLWYDLHRPRSRTLGRTSHVILVSDVKVSTIYNAAFIEEAARWRTLTLTGELRSIVVSTPDVQTINMDKFTPLHTFTVKDLYDIADIVYQVVSLLPCRDYTPVPFVPVRSVVQETNRQT